MRISSIPTASPAVEKRQRIQPRKNIDVEQRYKGSQYDAEKRNGILLFLKNKGAAGK